MEAMVDGILSDDPFADLPTSLNRAVKRTYSRRNQAGDSDYSIGLPSPPRSSSPMSSPVLRPMAPSEIQRLATSPPRRASTKVDPVRRSNASLFGTAQRRSLPVVGLGQRATKKPAFRSSISTDVTTSKPKQLVQMHLNLLPAHVTCKDCGMSYTRTSPGDVSLHATFHTTHLQGLLVPSSIAHSDAEILRMSYLKQSEMNLFTKCLEMIDSELSASSPALDSTHTLHAIVRKNRIVSFVTSHPLTGAFPVLEDGELALKPVETIVGISRMWTCKSFRGRGLVRQLLDHVLTSSVTGYRVKKEEVAFTQLSGSGEIVVKKWLAGLQVLVYND